MPLDDDPYGDILTAAAPKAPVAPAVPRGVNPTLIDFATSQQLPIGSTTNGRHNRGSKHYSGNAIDIHNSGGYSNDQVAKLSSLATDYGLKVRDERVRPKGQAVWGGPHIHIETNDDDPYADVVGVATGQAKPQPTADPYADVMKAAAPKATPAPTEAPMVQWNRETGAMVPQNPRSTSEVKDYEPTPEEVKANTTLPVVAPPKPLEFKQGVGAGDVPRVPGIAGLESAKYKTPSSQMLGEAVTAKLPEGQGGNPDAMANAALMQLGPQYVELNKAYKAATGSNMADVHGAKVNRDGTFAFHPSKHTIDFINAFASGNAEGGVQEGLKRAAQVNQDALLERQLAEQEARQAASGQVQQAENLLQGGTTGREAIGKGRDSFVARGIQSGMAPIAQAVGTVGNLAAKVDPTIGTAGQDIQDYSQTLRAASEQGDIENPAQTTGQNVAQGVGQLIPTALEFAATGPLGAAQLPVLGALHGTTPEERIKGGLEGAAMQGAFAAAPKVLGSLGPTAQKAVTGAAIMAPPVVQSIAAGQNPTQAIVGNLPFAALPFLHRGAGETIPEKPEAIAAQMEALKAGNRDAVLVTPGARRPPIPPGYRAENTSEGTFIYDPKSIDAKTIRAKVANGTTGELLGHVAPKPEPGEPTATVVARDAQGNEIQSSAVPPEAAPAQVESLVTQHPQANIEVGGNDLAQQVVNERLEEPSHHSNFQPRTEEGRFDGPPIVPASGSEPPIEAATASPEIPSVGTENTVTEGAPPKNVSDQEPIAARTTIPSTETAGGTSEKIPAVSESTTGIAHRVETAARGQEPPRGESIGAQESVERGRQLLRDGADPQKAIDDFQKSGAISAESMALVRAKHEELARVANQAYDKGGLRSPEFQAAEKARQDFYDNSVKPMQTAWSNTGRAQQGETGIDTGTFYGLYRAFKDSHSREPSPKEQVVLQNLSARSARTESDVKDLSSRLAAELDKAAGIKDLPTEVQQAVKRFIDQSARESRRSGRQQTRKALDDEAATIKQNLAAAFQKVKSQSGVQPSGLARIDPEGEITKQLIAYAKNRAKAGVTDAAQLIDDVHSTVKDFADITKREVAEAILGAGLPKSERTESEWAKIKSGVRQEVKDYTTQQAREELGARLQGGKKASPQDAAEVWKYARENYIDKGNNDFADVTQKVASDLGLTPDQVRRSLASTTATKRISDEMWKRMADRRQAKQNAESWVKQADQSLAAKRFEDARRLFFLKATLGHGAVAPATHAPVNAFIPSRWADFWRNAGRTYQFMVRKGGHEKAMVDLENSPNYITAQRAGLANDPKRGYDEYQSPWMAKTLGKLGISGNRAFDALKTMRQDFFDSAWNKMSKADQTPAMAKLLSEEINSSTGASKAFSGRDWPSRFVGKATFAAPLEASRWEFLVRDNARALQAFTNWKNATPEARYMAKRVASRNAQLVATYGSLLALNQGLLSATGSKDKVNVTDPTKADFLGFKIAGHSVSPASGMLTALRFVGTLASQAASADAKKPAQTVEDMAKTTFKYARSKLSPLFSTAADVAMRSDYGGRPLPFSKQEGSDIRPRYSWPEYLLSQQTPIPVGEAFRDVYHTMREQGMDDKQTKSLLTALAKAVPVAAVAATGVRVGSAYTQTDKVFGSEDSKGRVEVQRLNIPYMGAKKSKDETAEQFKEREKIQNDLTKRTIEATVALPNYKDASDADKIEYLKRARQQAAQRAKEKLEELHPEREEQRDLKKEQKDKKAEENPLPDISSLRVPRGLRRPVNPFRQRFSQGVNA